MEEACETSSLLQEGQWSGIPCHLLLAFPPLLAVGLLCDSLQGHPWTPLVYNAGNLLQDSWVAARLTKPPDASRKHRDE